MTLENHLAHLTSAGLVRLGQSDPELEYLFRHALIQEAAYESLLKNDRRILHRIIAEVLQTLYPQQLADLSPMLAHHYRLAGDVEGEYQYLRLAAEQATARFGNSEAVNYFARLLELTPNDHPVRSMLALQLAEAHYGLGDFHAAHAAIEQAEASAPTDSTRAAALALLGEMTSEMGNYAEAQTILAKAVSLARASGDQLALCRVLYALGDVNWRLGKLNYAQATLNESLTLARALGDVTRELFALNRLAVVIGQQGDLDEKERLLTEVYTRAVSAGNRERAMMALNNLGAVANERMDYATQRGYQQQALALAREIGAQSSIALFLIALSFGDIKLGELAAARTKLREGLALALRLGAFSRVVQAVMNFAELAHAEGQTEQALALFGLARRHPAWSSDDRRDLDLTLAEWALDPAVVEAGLAQGAALDWEATLQELLKG